MLRSIVLVLSLYGTLEALAFAAVAKIYGFPASVVPVFIVLQALFHLGLVFFLWISMDFFFIEKTGEKLLKVNIANKVTLLRISMLPTVLFLILAAKDYKIAPVLAPVLALTFLTDLIDGRLSRAKNQVTLIGRILDSVSDYALLIVIAVAYRVFGILPNWLFLVIFFRFLFQAVGMLCVIVVRKRVEPKPTMFGKVAVATTMSLFAAEAVKMVLPHGFGIVFEVLEYVAGAVVSLSVIDKGIFFAKELAKGRPRQPSE